MGHSRIGELPRTRRWDQVINLIALGADVTEVAAETSDAAERSLLAAAHDPALRHTFWLLTQLPQAATSNDFQDALARLAVYVRPEPSLTEICCAFLKAVDQKARRAKGITDLGELAELSATECLHEIAGRELFRYGAANPQTVLAKSSTPKGFGALAREFFARLTRRYLDYYLSRELPNHVGITARFHSSREHDEFEQALSKHCYEASEIAEKFASDWLSKHMHEGGITERKAGNFVHIAFEKIQKELRYRRDARD